VAVVLGLHVLIAAACAVTARYWGSRVFALGALAPAVGFGWLLTTIPDVLTGRERYALWQWAPTLQLQISLRLDGLALLLGLLVTGIGALVLLYATRYFQHRAHGLGRIAAVLVLFAGSMLALVLADNVLALYVAWELTTVCSFLLIGDDGQQREERRAAGRALLVTTGAGFALLLGLLLLAEVAGTYRIARILDDPPDGGWVTVAVILILIGAAAKSAQIPFQPWLPAAMVAPTPISAYLHAAAMVKAGVYLVARLAPAFAEVMPWRPVVLTVGVATMLLGGWRALTQTDLKRLLAFGTIAQLGFLLALMGAGTQTAALAGATMLLAHALFKATLFLTVGIIDHGAGTRDLRQLSGVARRAPLLAVTAALACVSMAGLPPTVGYLGKEAAFQAFLEPGTGHRWVLIGLVTGSTLTIAYTLRFWWGAFGNRPGVPVRMERPPVSFVAPVALIAATGVALGLAPAATDALTARHAYTHPHGETGYHLELWHGLGAPLYLALLTLVAGAVIHLLRDQIPTWRARLPSVPRATRIQDSLAVAVMVGARAVTTRTQVGSLPTYLMVILTVVAVGPGLTLVLGGEGPIEPRLWDSPPQAILAIGVTITVAGVVMVHRRLIAVLLLSAVGYLVAGLFVLHGAPDLALVQVLVETLTLLVFVLVLRRMPPGVRPTAPSLWAPRAVVAVLAGLFVTIATLTVSANHAPSPATQDYLRLAPEAGGPNVVNVIVTEFRALDTLGEITVLAIAATGVASLILVSHRTGGVPRRETIAWRSDNIPRTRLLPAAHQQAPGRRTLLLEAITRVIHPSMLVVASYLLLVGLHRPGGGFAAGLVVGLGMVLRRLAGGSRELWEITPVPPGVLLGTGLFLTAGYGLAGLLWTGDPLSGAVYTVDLGPLGHLELATSLIFEAGIAVIVTGLVLDILRTLGAYDVPTSPAEAVNAERSAR